MTGVPFPRTDRRPAVAHVMEAYLGLTETFIYDYLVSFRRVRPVVVARRLENLAAFPLPREHGPHLSPPRRGTASWAAAAMARRIRGGEPHLERLLATEEVRVIHAHFGPTACGLLETRRRTGLPLVASFYGYDASTASVVAEFGGRYRALFDLGDAFLVEGPAMKARLEALGCPSSKLRIQRIAIDPARYRFRAREDPGGGPVTVLQCGRLVAKKGCDTLLSAFALARRHDPRLKLRLVGDGPERPALESLIRDLGLGDSVTLLGALSRSSLLDEMDRAHIYAQASRTAADGDTEGGAPTALLEAQACGLPIVATRHADIPHVVSEGDSALLSEEGDSGSLAASLALLAAEPARWGPMGRAGRAHVETRHDVGALSTALEVLYATVAETGRLSMAPVGR